MKDTLILFRYAHGAIGITGWGMLILFSAAAFGHWCRWSK